MFEYLVDFIGWRQVWLGDDARKQPEPRKHYYKLPLNTRLTEHCNLRAADGWRLVSTDPCRRGLSVVGIWLYFERQRKPDS